MSRVPQQWDLSGLYDGMDDDRIGQSQASARKCAQKLEEEYKGKVAATRDARSLAPALTLYETIRHETGRLARYGQLLTAQRRDDETVAFYNRMVAFQEDMHASTAFLREEIAGMSKSDFAALLSAPEVESYRPWLRYIRDVPASASTDGRLRERINSKLADWADRSFPAVDGGKKTEDALASDLSSADRALRKTAMESLNKGYTEKSAEAAQDLSDLLKDWQRHASHRGFSSVKDMVLADDQIPGQVYDAAMQAAGNFHKTVCHDYFALKQKLYGHGLGSADQLSSPLPEAVTGARPRMDYDGALSLISSALDGVSPHLSSLLQETIDGGRIDARADVEGKEPLAQNIPIAGEHSYVTLQYGDGTLRDSVLLLAHELGHAVHYAQANEKTALFEKSYGMPPPLLETFSLFTERVVFEEYYSLLTDPREKAAALADYLEDMFFYHGYTAAAARFEEKLHADLSSGKPVNADSIAQHWMETQKSYWGSAFQLEEGDRNGWASYMVLNYLADTPHYFYAYGLAAMAASLLYQEYQKDPAGFVPKYLAMQRAGHDASLPELLEKNFGIRLDDSATLEKPVADFRSLLDEMTDNLSKLSPPVLALSDSSPSSSQSSSASAGSARPPGRKTL